MNDAALVHSAICSRLEALLSDTLGAPITVAGYTRLAGGYSREMARFDATVDGTTFAMIARTDKDDDHKLVKFDSADEWDLLSALTSHRVRFAPTARLFDTAGALHPTPTMILDYVPGEGLTAALLDDARNPQKLVDAVCDLAVEIHQFDTTALPGPRFRVPSWDTYLSTSIDQWRQMDADHVESNPFIRYVAGWLDSHRPKAAPLVLLHGDLQPPNLVLTDEEALIAVDWEFAHVGDPREDIGWLQMIEGFSATTTYGRDPEGFCARYRAATGLGEDIINPGAVSYFSILALGRIFASLYRQIGDLARGTNRSLTVAYSAAAAITASHPAWMRQIEQLTTAASDGRTM